MSYEFLKFLHITGVVMLMGNITATAIWKFFADRTGDPRVIGFAQKLVTYTDWSLTFWGVLLTIGGGYGMALSARMALFEPGWLLWSQGLFVVAGLIWLDILVPIQIRQARQAKNFSDGGTIPSAFRHDSSRWIIWGLVATVPLVGALWLMIAKPF